MPLREGFRELPGRVEAGADGRWKREEGRWGTSNLQQPTSHAHGVDDETKDG
jgi:hypothetical protein